MDLFEVDVVIVDSLFIGSQLDVVLMWSSVLDSELLFIS